MTETRRNSKLLMLQIRQVFLEDWDPLHVGENPNLSDEYDAYIGPLIGLARRAGELSVGRITGFLESCEKHEMEVVGDKHARDLAAKKLFEILGNRAD
jgi:hypothetical protein